MKFSKPLSLILIFVLLAGLCGCAGGTASVTAESAPIADAPQQKLALSVTFDMNADFTTITSEELNGNFPEDITYIDFTEVNITIDGTEYSLDAAIRDDHTTVEQIIADARTDVKNGFCKELYETEHSLTRFVYQYPDFELEYAYDVLEAPDGSQHLIQDFAVYPVNKHISVSHGISTTDENGHPIGLLREDWGLSIEIANVTPTGITLTCTQSGGQQIGELFTQSYFIDLLDQKVSGWDLEVISVEVKDAIQMDGTCTLQFDWSEYYGELSSDDYIMVLSVEDEYDPSDVHPLMQNFADVQRYFIEFTIP